MERQSNKAPRLDGIVLTIAKNKTSLVHPPPYQILFKSSDLLFEKHFFFWAFFFSFFATLARNMKGEARRSPSSLFFSFSLALFFFLSLCPDECLGAKWYVRNGFEGGTGTFDHPYGNLEDAFTASSTGDEITAFPGTYPPEKNSGFILSSPELFRSNIIFTSISSDMVVVNLTGQDFFLSLPSQAQATISSFTFIGSNGDVFRNQGDLTVENCNFYENYNGDCIHDSNGILTVRNSNFTGPQNGNRPFGAIGMFHTIGHIENCNFADFYSHDEGGAIFVQSSSTQTEIQNCYFKNNSAPSGGALYLKEGVTVTVKGSTFEGNSADSEGGAIYSESILSLDTVKFIQNTAQNEGGAVFQQDHAAEFTKCTWVENGALSVDAKGGAISCESELGLFLAIAIKENDFSDNYAQFGGAIFSETNSKFDISSTNFTNNFAELDGGAIAAVQVMEISQTMFNNNTAGRSGGGLYIENGAYSPDANLYTNFCTFHDNEAVIGGGIYMKNCTGFEWENFDFHHNKAGFGGAMALTDGSEGQLIAIQTYENIATEGKGADFYFQKAGSVSFSSLKILTNTTTPYRPQTIVHIEGKKEEKNVIQITDTSFKKEDVSGMTWPGYYFVKDADLVCGGLVPPVELHNASLTYCNCSNSNCFIQEINMEDSDVYLSPDTVVNNFKTTNHAGIQRGPSTKDTCLKGPFFFDETVVSSPIVLDIDDFSAGKKIVSQNVEWNANFLDLYSEESEFYIFGGSLIVESSAILSEGSKIGDPKNKSFVLTVDDYSSAYFSDDVIIYGDLSMLKQTSLYFIFEDDGDLVEVEGNFQIVDGREINTTWVGGDNQTIEEGDVLVLMTWNNELDWTSEKQFEDESLYSPSSLFPLLTYSSTSLSQTFTSTPPPPPPPMDSSSTNIGAVFLLIALLVLLLVIVGGIIYVWRMYKKSSGSGEVDEFGDGPVQRKTGGWFGFQDEEGL